MNIRNTVFLFCLSMGFLWLFGLMLAYKRTPTEEGLILPTLKQVPNGAIESVTVQFKEGDKTLEFFQKKEGWEYGKNRIRVDAQPLNKMLDEIRSVGKLEEDTIPTDNDLEKPRIVITIKGATLQGTTKKTHDWRLDIGKVTKSNIVLVKSSDRPGQVFAVAQAALQSVFHIDIDEFRSTQPFELKDLSVKQIVLLQPARKEEKKAELEVQKSEDGLWKIIQPAGLGYADFAGDKSAEPPEPDLPLKKLKKQAEVKSGIKLLIGKINALKVESTADFVPADKEIDLSTYGLKEGEETLSIKVVSADSKGDKTDVLLIGKKYADKDQYFARMAGDNGVFKLNGKQLEPIRQALTNPRELRSKDIIFFDAKKVDLVRLSAGPEECVLSHPEGKPWSMRFGSKSFKANESAVQNFLKALTDARISKFADDADDAKLGLNAPMFSAAIYEDAKPKSDEKKPAGEGSKDDARKDDKEKKEEVFAVAAEPGLLEGKDRSTEATFKFGKPKSVSPTDDKLVKAEVVGEKVKFTQVGEPEKEDKTVEFTVRGSKDGKEEKDFIKVKVTVLKKPVEVLTFGTLDSSEGMSVKRVLQDGTIQRFYLTKDLADKIVHFQKVGDKNVPADVFLTYLDTTLPDFDAQDVAGFTLQRGKDKLELDRLGTDWYFNNPSALASENLADAAKVTGRLSQLLHLRAEKWVQKIDASTDLAKFGLKDKSKGIEKDKEKEYPAVTATFIVAKTLPRTAASIIGLVGSDNFYDSALVVSQMLRGQVQEGKTSQLGWIGGPGQTVVLEIGRESEDKDNPGTYARFTVADSKEAKSTNDLIFLLPTELVKGLMKEDFHDRKAVLNLQPSLDAAAVAVGPAGWPLDLLGQAPLINPRVLTFEPSKVVKIHLETRRREFRKFAFARDKAPEKSKAGDKDKSKSASEPVSLKGQTWKDESGLVEFTIDSDRINDFVEQLARLDALHALPEVVRLTTLTDGPRAFQKLGPKDAVMKLDIFLEGNATPLTLTVGAAVDLAKVNRSYYAMTSTAPAAVFIIPPEIVDEALRGTAFFGKDPAVGP